MKTNENNQAQTDKGRDFNAEALNLIHGLREKDLYRLYGIVKNQTNKSTTTTRDRELAAVKKAIEDSRFTDNYRLKSIWEGYKSEMAQTARVKDGFTIPPKKKN